MKAQWTSYVGAPSGQIEYVFWDVSKSKKCCAPTQSSQNDNENSYWFGDVIIALTVDGELTIKSQQGGQLSKEFKTLNERICSADIEYSSIAFHSTYEQLALFDPESTDRAKIEILSMDTSLQ